MGMYEIFMAILVIVFVSMQWIGLQYSTNEVVNVTQDIYYNGTNTSLPSDYSEQFTLASDALYIYPAFLILVLAVWAIKKTGEEKNPYA